MLHPVQQEDRCHHRHADGNEDAEEDGEIVRPVHACRFIEFDGHPGEGGAHDDEIEGVDGAGDDHGPDFVGQPQRVDDQVGRNDSPRKLHGKYHHQHEEFPSRQVGAR